MKKLIAFALVAGLEGLFPVFAQESIPDFECVPIATSCGKSALACGF